MADSPLAKKVMPRRSAAKRAAGITSGILDSSDSEGPSTSQGIRTKSPRARTPESVKRRVTKVYSVKKRRLAVLVGDLSENEEPSCSPPSPPALVPRVARAAQAPASSANRKGRPNGSQKYTQDDFNPLFNGEESDLTPLSSLPQSPVQETKPLPLSDHQHELVRDHPMFPSSRSRIPLSERLQLLARDGKAASEDWSLTTLGKYVWVLLKGRNGKTADVYDLGLSAGPNKGVLWWPGMIEGGSSKPPISVVLFGSSCRTVTVEKPSSENILSRLNSLSFPLFPSYETATQTGSRSDSAKASPRKKQKIVDKYKTAWELAVFQMHEKVNEDAIENDEPPEVAEVLATSTLFQGLQRTQSVPNLKTIGTPKTKGSNKGKRKYQSDSEDYDFLHEDDTHPPPSHGDLTIPGELVLARPSKRSLTEYWPAKLLEYVPPKKRSKDGIYKILFFDGSRDAIPRSLFYTLDDQDFAICTMGRIESSVQDDPNDEDDGNLLKQPPPRSPSPTPVEPPPDPFDFLHLPIREQFTYTKGILRAILNNEYEPVREKLRAFMKGGKAKAKIAETAGSRGMMDPRHIDDISRYLVHWCLRDGLRVRKGDVEDNLSPEHQEPEASKSDERAHGKTGDEREKVDIPASPTPTEAILTSSPPEEPPESSFSPLSQLSTTEDVMACSSLTCPSKTVAETVGLEPSHGELAGLQGERGYPEYEALSPLEKINFCTNILLPEAVRQILLWRAGERTSVEPLTPEEEAVLYEKGQKLLDERDWVYDVLRIRGRMAGILATKQAGSAGGRAASGRSGRIRKVVNYQE